jgi:hypothetical protein
VSEPLKPCPFCGGKADSRSAIDFHRVRCLACDCEVYHDSRSLAEARWNRRAPGPATANVLNLIRDCLDVAGVAEVIIGEETARAMLAEHEPAKAE